MTSGIAIDLDIQIEPSRSRIAEPARVLAWLNKTGSAEFAHPKPCLESL
jgi:hypothetical protein